MSAPVWAVIVNWNAADLTSECIQSLQDCGYEDLTILVVDNGSEDGSGAELERKFPEVRHLALGANFGYAGGNAAGMEEAVAHGAFAVLVINNDCTVTPGFLDPLVQEMIDHPRTGADGPVQLNHVDGQLVWANGGSQFDMTTETIYPDGPTGPTQPPPEGRFKVGYICGACIMFRAEALREVGGYDPRLFLGSEEPDWTIRAARHGWETVTIPASVVTHRGGVSTTRVPAALAYLYTRNRLWVIRRHGTRVQAVLSVFRTLFWRAPKAALRKIIDGEYEVAYAGALGALAGLFADCNRGREPESALSGRVFEIAPPSIESRP